LKLEKTIENFQKEIIGLRHFMNQRKEITDDCFNLYQIKNIEYGKLDSQLNYID
jgi:hypothetical protein